VNIEYQPEFDHQEITLQKENIFKYSDLDYIYDNTIPNGSFEDGLWQEKAGDCSNYDDKGDIGMNISEITSDGASSLQLAAKRHNACTSTAFPVNENSVYLFSFDYQSPNAKNAGYYLQFNDEANTVFRDILDINGTDWQKFDRNIRVPAGATSARLYVYSYETDKENKQCYQV